MIRKRIRLRRFIKNFPDILILVCLFLCSVSNMRMSSQISDMRSELSEIEMSNTVIAMSSTKKKVPVVSSKFFNEYLPGAEGFSDTVYKCSSGDRTIGYGTNLSKNSPEMLIEYNYMSVSDDGSYTMTKYQAKRAASLWIAENNRYFEQFSEKYIGVSFSELPQQIKDFIVLMCYKSGGRGLLEYKKDAGRFIGEFIDCGMDTDSEAYNNMILSAGGDSNRQCVYRSIFE